MITGDRSRERKTTEREDPSHGPGPGRDTTPTVGPEMTDHYPEIRGRGREGKPLLAVKDLTRETKHNQKREEIYVRSTAD